MNKKMTIVIDVIDRAAMQPLYEAHIGGQPVLGCIPRILAWDDQVTVPADLVAGLAALDPNAVNATELRRLIDEAEKFLGIG